MNSCIGGVWSAWSGGGDIGGWPACLLVKLLVEGTICILALYYIGHILSDWCMNLCMGGDMGGDMGGCPACLLVKLLVEGTICILAFYYIG